MFCGLFLTWIQWCVIQCGTHHGIDDWPRRGVRRDAAESEPLSMGVCFQTDLSAFTRDSPMLDSWIPSRGCDLSPEPQSETHLGCPYTAIAILAGKEYRHFRFLVLVLGVFFFFGHTAWPVGSWFHNQGSNWWPLQ